MNRIWENNPQLPGHYRVVGVMSGTSLDGLDVCLCEFWLAQGQWRYSIVKSQTIEYVSSIKQKLETAFGCSACEIAKLDYEYGKWIGRQVNNFLAGIALKPQLVASHGHTIFHNPTEGYTLQIGKGAAIASETGLPCVSDFRSSDVSRGGQGAPLVPIGDKLLFPEYSLCLNLGGFSNVSYDVNGVRVAYDVSPCNMLLNHLARKLNAEYDRNGEWGEKGHVNENLLAQLDALPFYAQDPPKSLGKEWFLTAILPILDSTCDSIENMLRTAYEHIANQVSSVTNRQTGSKILVTGGGAKNEFLIHLLRNKSKHSIVTPGTETIDYKEALIFAFLGVLYMERKAGALSSATGANKDSIAGCLYY